MGTPDFGGWQPPAEAAPAPAEAAAPAPVAEAPVVEAPVNVVPPAPAVEVTTGPVAEAPADLPAADPTPVAEPAPVVDTGVANATPVEPAAVPEPTPAGSGPEAPLDAPVPVHQSASNGPTTTAEQSLRTEAAKAYHLLGHLLNVGREVQARIERFVPPEVLAAGEQEALALLRELI